MKPPIGFVYGNCVFGALDDGWAAFAVETGLRMALEDGKRARFLALLGALEAIEADVQILRVGRRWIWSVTRASWATLGAGSRRMRRNSRAREALCARSTTTSGEIGGAQPEVFLS